METPFDEEQTRKLTEHQEEMRVSAYVNVLHISCVFVIANLLLSIISVLLEQTNFLFSTLVAIAITCNLFTVFVTGAEIYYLYRWIGNGQHAVIPKLMNDNVKRVRFWSFMTFFAGFIAFILNLINIGYMLSQYTLMLLSTALLAVVCAVLVTHLNAYWFEPHKNGIHQTEVPKLQPLVSRLEPIPEEPSESTKN